MSDILPTPNPEVCPQCGAVLSTAAGGLCARCVMEEAAQPSHGPGVEPPSHAEVAAAFAQFEILEFIGKGGMGTVWKARQPTLNRAVALKLLPASLAERDPAFAERFAREGQLLARLHHPNIVAVYDSGRAGDFFYLAMEFVDGVNLRQAMRASRFTASEALAIVPRICEAVQYAHEEGVLHRDIKPENILLDTKGRVKLVDFGIAKLIAQPEQAFSASAGAPAAVGDSLTLGGATLGTPNYMAPEQIEHPSEVDYRADVYSLGVVFYELLTGELPVGDFPAPSQKSGVDPRLDGIVRQALEKERGRRQQSAGEMGTQVESLAGSAAVPPRKEPVAVAPSEEGRFSRTAIVGACWMGAFFVTLIVSRAVSFRAGESHEPSWWQSALKLTLLPAAMAGPFGTTILGWIALAQIRRSTGRLCGLGLALFDALFFPLLALCGVLVWLAGALAKLFVDFYANPELLHNTAVHPALVTRLANLLSRHPELAFLAGGALALGASACIVEAVRRAQGPKATRSRLAPTTLGAVALGFGILSGFIPTVFYWLAPWLAPWLSPDGREFMLGLAVLSALLALSLGFAARKSWQGRNAMLIGIISLTLWLLFFVAGLFSMPDAHAQTDRQTASSLRSNLAGREARAPAQAPVDSTPWSPAPDSKPDLQAVFTEAQQLREQERYEEALQRHLWLHRHGLEIDPSYSAVRLSFWLSDWMELARRYPRARQALVDTRDAGAEKLAAGRGYFELFMEVQSINTSLQDPAATLALFNLIEKADPALARQCAPLVEERTHTDAAKP